MKITKGDKTIDISGVGIFLGLLVVDNIVVNICKTKSYKNLCKALKNEEEKEES